MTSSVIPIYDHYHPGGNSDRRTNIELMNHGTLKSQEDLLVHAERPQSCNELAVEKRRTIFGQANCLLIVLLCLDHIIESVLTDLEAIMI